MKKTALITGAARGIGFGIARELAKENCDLVVCDIQQESDYQSNMDELRSLGAKVLYCRCDVSSPADRQSMLDTIKSVFGRLNILVNNAGVAPRVRADILEASEESFERLIKINLQGPYFLTKLFANWMIGQKKADPSYDGCIINMSSVSADVASVSRGDYCISKAGVSMATKLWAARLGEFDIPVYEIRPGIIKTDMTSAVTEKYDKLIAEGLCVQKRWGFPEDIGKVAAMMARGDIGYSSGQVINVDGGMSIGRL